jgi:glucokinase
MAVPAGFPVLLADIGGTFARFSILADPGGPFHLLAKDLTTAHPNVSSAIASALDNYAGAKAVSALLALAGRVSGSVAHLTNAGWTVDAQTIGRELGLKHVMLVNDYSAAAAALPTLGNKPETGLLRIGPELKGEGPQVILGPGTGLGAAGISRFGQRMLIQSTEAGHIDFGAISKEELELWPMIERPRGRLSAETLLSGPGLVRLYRAVARQRKIRPDLETPSEVVESGLSGKNPLATEVMQLFARLLGRFAGDLGLVFGATGGVFIAGGIALRMADVLARSEFRTAFESKSPFEAVMGDTPTFLVTHPEPVLVGLATLAAQPRRFMLHAAHWRSRAV